MDGCDYRPSGPRIATGSRSGRPLRPAERHTRFQLPRTGDGAASRTSLIFQQSEHPTPSLTRKRPVTAPGLSRRRTPAHVTARYSWREHRKGARGRPFGLRRPPCLTTKGAPRAPLALKRVMRSYLISTEPPASSISALSFSASSLSTPSLTGLGASSTSALASLRPRPVAARTTLMTWIFLSPEPVRMTSNAVCSSSASAASPPPPRRRGAGDGHGRRGDAEGLLEGLDALGELEDGDRLELVDPLLGAGGHVS